jgi:hypothetical protein
MAQTRSEFRLPLFTFMLKDGSGAVFLRAGELLWLPLFTSSENALLHRQRGKLDCILLELSRWEDVLAYVSDPPSRASRVPCDSIVVDPIDPATGDYTLFDRIAFLAAVKSKVAPKDEPNTGAPGSSSKG